MFYVFGLGLVVFAAGYFFGRRDGLAIGVGLGRTGAPLALRQQALSTGTCPTCDYVFKYCLSADDGRGESYTYC